MVKIHFLFSQFCIVAPLYTYSVNIVPDLEKISCFFHLMNAIIYYFQSGSQNDLCDSWVGEEDEESKEYSRTVEDRNSHQGSKYTDPGSITSTASPQRGDVGLVQYHQPKAAEYPFQTNLCMPPQGVNFDLTHKRGNTHYFSTKL